jgi:protein-S-isoprenylcysteine O-methyltransferase Ste14
MAGAAGMRALTVAAAAFLAFDGVALLVGGIWLRRVVLIVMGMVIIAGSLLVGVYWRWHRRQAGEIAAARQALASEARQLQDLIRRN